LPEARALTVNTAVPKPPAVIETVGVLKEEVRPTDDDAESAMLPENPLRLPRVMSDVAGTPAGAVIVKRLAEMLKSTTLTVTITE
jgi:hypothetical protein